MARPPIKRRGPKRDTTLPSKLNKQARSKLQQRNHRERKKLLAIKKVPGECFVSLENIKIPSPPCKQPGKASSQVLFLVSPAGERYSGTWEEEQGPGGELEEALEEEQEGEQQEEQEEQGVTRSGEERGGREGRQVPGECFVTVQNMKIPFSPCRQPGKATSKVISLVSPSKGKDSGTWEEEQGAGGELEEGLEEEKEKQGGEQQEEQEKQAVNISGEEGGRREGREGIGL